MKKIILIALCILTWGSYGNNGRYRLSLRDNPATSIVVGWDQLSGTNPTVYYGTTDYGTDYTRYPNTKTADRVVSYKGMNNHFARLTGLIPNTAYYFVIRDSQGTSARFWFKTAPSDNSRLSFIAGGDSRNNRTPRKNANRLVAKLKPHAVLFGGDMTNGDSSGEWRDWFDDWQLTIAGDNRMFPIVAARGNHEDSNNSIYNLFDVPSTSVYYALTFGKNLVRAYTLNTEISISGNQTNWLKNDLNAHPNVLWKMAQYHKPMRPHVSSKREGNSQYSNWAQLFYDKEVKLVVECDSHTVKSTWPVRPTTGSGNDEGFIREDQNGTVYVGEGCWGAPLRSNNDSKSWTRNSSRFNQFKWIFVDENKIETRTIKVDNASQVGEVSNSDVFQIPANLDIWNPSNGSVITISASSVPSYTVTTNTTGEGSVDGGGVYKEGEQITLTATPQAGWEFEKWTGGATGTTNPIQLTVTSDLTVTAVFKKINGGNTGTLGIITIGDKNSRHATRRAMPYTMTESGTLKSVALHVEGGVGSVQVGVYRDQNGVPGDRIGKTAVTAVRSARGWQHIPLETSVRITSGTTVWLAWIFSDNPGIAYVSGTPGRYQATNSSWSSSGNNMPTSYGNGSQSNYRYSIYAVYEKSSVSEYTVSTSVSGQGTVDGAGVYASGTQLSLKATPQPGWKFDSWSGGASGTENPLTITVNSDVSVTAVFKENTGGTTATLGITTVGDRTSKHATRRAMPYTMSESGILKSVSLHVEGGSGSVQVGVYEDVNGVPGNLLGKTSMTAVQGTRGWQTISLINPVTVSSGSTVWLAWIFSNNPGIAYITGSPGRYQATNSQWVAGQDNMPTAYGSGSQSDYKYSIYATYEVSNNLTTSSVERNEDTPSAIALYPNPFTADLYLDIPSDAVKKVFIEVRNLNGKTVYHTVVTKVSDRVALPVQNLKKGVYFIVLKSQTGNTLLSDKIIKR
ncbi:T9SS type A sorting domain-containing protein [Aquimarina sp. TRL1]|uniref:InlB B-repeat-containing protein n=1 Tax=Aquimarina sp. (strain TRL1) TaxID=2736252 RepID=UPI00158D3485|nr:fibronectin type III domain-containing protein [Aquimarina sp. TRL1]QKX07098.1 T9SS type A sorting domain-containing protein [Aquimarina sp. TRL1]